MQTDDFPIKIKFLIIHSLIGTEERYCDEGRTIDGNDSQI